MEGAYPLNFYNTQCQILSLLDNNQQTIGESGVGHVGRKGTLLSFLLIFLVIPISGCANQEIGKSNEEKLKETIPTPQPRPPSEELGVANELNVSPYLPKLSSWKLIKGKADSSLHGCVVPRVPKLLYQRNVSVISTVLAEKDRIYLVDIGGIYALNATTGELVWGLDVSAVAKAPMGGEEGYVDLEQNKRAQQGWDVDRWRFITLGTEVSLFGSGVGRYAYIATKATQPDVLGSYQAPVIVAVDKHSGEIVWKKNFGSAGQSTTGNLVVSENTVCVASGHGVENAAVYCFTEDGEQKWSQKVDDRAILGMAVGRDTLYVVTQKTLYAFDLENGNLQWSYLSKYGGMSAPLAKDDTVFIYAGGELVAIKNGEELWKVAGLGIGSDIYDNPYMAASDNFLYAVRNVGERPLNLYTIDFRGNIVNEFTFKGEPAGSPVVAGNLVLLPVRVEEKGECVVHILWRGNTELYSITLPDIGGYVKLSSAHGRIHVVQITGYGGQLAQNVLTVYGDDETPIIENVSDVSQAHAGENVKVSADLEDSRSAIYRALLFYRINSSLWHILEMNPERRYVIEPIGGYGFSKEPFSAVIPVQPAGSVVEYSVVTIDNVGNYAFSEVRSYVVLQPEAQRK